MTKMWVTEFILNENYLTARLLPYDGTRLLALGGTSVRPTKVASLRQNPQVAAILDALEGKVAIMADNTSGLRTLRVMAPDPAKPVGAIATFQSGRPHRIADCFSLCATDPAFAQIFTTTMGLLATLAGLEIQ